MAAPFILLVEDNEFDEELTLRELANRLALAIEVVRDGAEAVDFLHARGSHSGRHAADIPVLILLDAHLPRLSGAEVLARMADDARLRSVPALLLTSSGEDEEAQRARAGARGYLRKPITISAFGEALDRLGLRDRVLRPQ